MCQNIMITLLLLYSYRPVCFPTYPYTIVLYRFQGIRYKVWCVSKRDYRCITAAVESPFPLLTCLHTRMDTLEFIANYCCTAVVTWSLYEHTVAVLISQLFSTLTATYPDRRVFLIISSAWRTRHDVAYDSHLLLRQTQTSLDNKGI